MDRTGLSKLETAGRDSFQIETIGRKREREIIKVLTAVNLESEEEMAESRPCGCRVGASGPLRSLLIFIHGNVSTHGSGSDNDYGT
jgi:hypothetical protein